MTVEEVIQEILMNVFTYSEPPLVSLDEDNSYKNKVMHQLYQRLPQSSKRIAQDIINKDNRFFGELGGNPITRRFLKYSVSKGNIPRSIDLLHVGSGSMEVTGIMITFSASVAVIKKAIESGCNLIITHEPTFYIHEDEHEQIMETQQYKQKRKLLEENRIAVWRFHDLCHFIEKDFIVDGVLNKAGYDTYVKKTLKSIPIIERSTTVDTIINEMKEKLGAQAIRLMGDSSMVVNRYCILVGMPDSVVGMQLIEEADLDLIIIGEMHEWELGDFVKDGISLSKKRALLIIGHQPSEMAGMEYFAEWLKVKMPKQRILYEETENLFQNV